MIKNYYKGEIIMKTKKLMRKTLAVAMAAAMLCTGAAVIP